MISRADKELEKYAPEKSKTSVQIHYIKNSIKNVYSSKVIKNVLIIYRKMMILIDVLF